MTDSKGRYADLDPLCEIYAVARNRLAQAAEELRHDIARLKSARLDEIRKAAATAAEAKGKILDLIAANPEDLFPPEAHRRSVTLHGVRAGVRQAPGTLRWTNPAKVVERIRERYTDEVGVLVKVTETPARSALKKLPPADLRALGIRIEGGGEYAFVSVADDEIDKWVDRLLDEDGLADE